jgi:hypothetical protein
VKCLWISWPPVCSAVASAWPSRSKKTSWRIYTPPRAYATQTNRWVTWQNKSRNHSWSQVKRMAVIIMRVINLLVVLRWLLAVRFLCGAGFPSRWPFCCCVFDYDVDLVGRGWSNSRRRIVLLVVTKRIKDIPPLRISFPVIDWLFSFVILFRAVVCCTRRKN